MRRCSPLLLLALAGCPRGTTEGAGPAGSASSGAPASAASASTSSRGRVEALRSAENRRDVAAVTEADVTASDAGVRRAAARALARIASDEARPGLLRLLSDEDDEAAAFAAYGLAWTCREHEDEHVKALAARSVTLEKPSGGRVDVATALGRALGRCGTVEAEGVLAAWLKGPRPRAAAAALGLGDMAGRRPLQEDTLVSLTKLASEGLGEALFPFGRADPPGSAVLARVREVAAQRLSVDDPTRIFAVRALGRTDEAAAPDLKRVLTGSFRDAERAEAARALGRLGDRGQQALGEALPGLSPPGGEAALAALVSDGFGPLTVLLDTLRAPAPRGAREPLAALARLPLPDDKAPAAVRRRAVRLRCGAAKLLAPQPDDPALLGCDPAAESAERDLARLAVLGRDPLKGARRLALLRELLLSRDARVRTEAFEALGAHREIEGAAPLFVQGLKAPHAGTVAAAAKALALRSDQSNKEVEKALLQALDRPFQPDDTETVAALLRAAGALKLAEARKHLERHCASSSPTLRANAQGALALLGDRQPRCLKGPPLAAPAPELERPLAGQRLVLDTDVGELTITVDPALAPTAAARLVELAEAGFFDDMAVHRVVPGFVVQFGDRAGDGTGGAGREALRCETSPLPFGPLAVGVALDGRDTGSSQFFVTLARAPHLDGEYALVGSATGDWAAVAEGDRIRKARVAR